MPLSDHPSILKTQPDNEAPIGVFDSGVGGLSVLKAIHHLLPRESLLYCADSRYTPYGDHTSAFVTDRTLAIGDWLASQGAKAIVVACNTATTQSIAALRDHLSIPVIGVEPGVKPAALHSISRVAGVLATAGTLKSEKFQKLTQTHAVDCKLVCVAGVGLVEAIESGDIDSPSLLALLQRYLQPMLDAGADTLALGCTHYPFLTPLIRQLVGQRLQIIDNSPPVARQLERTLALLGQLRGHLSTPAQDVPSLAQVAPVVPLAACDGTFGIAGTEVQRGPDRDPALSDVGKLRFFSTGETAQLIRLAKIGLNLDIEVAQVTIASALTCSA